MMGHRQVAFHKSKRILIDEFAEERIVVLLKNCPKKSFMVFVSLTMGDDRIIQFHQKWSI